MSKTWTQVEQSQEYQSLSPQDKANAKKQYFDNVVSQKQEFNSLDQESQKEAKRQFFGGTQVQDIPESEFTPKNVALETAKGTAGYVGDRAKKILQGAGQAITHPVDTAGGTLKKIGEESLNPIDKIKGILGTGVGVVQNIPGSPLGLILNQLPNAEQRKQQGLDFATDTALTAGAGGFLGKIGGMAPSIAKGLEESSAKSYAKALGATTKSERELTSKVVPGLVEKKKVFATRGGLLDKAQEETEKAGEHLEVGYLTLPKKSRVEAGAVVKSIEDKQEALKVNGILPDVNKQHFDQLERVKNDFTSLAKDKNVSPQTLREIRQVYDKAIETSKQGFKMTGRGGARLNAQRVLANSIRREIAKKYPSISALNKEFSFWSNLGDLLETTAPKTKSPLSSFHAFAAEHAGAANPYVGLFVNLNKIFSDNVLVNSLSGAAKSHLASLISKGSIEKAAAFSNSLLSKTKNTIKGMGTELNNLGEKFVSAETDDLTSMGSKYSTSSKSESYRPPQDTPEERATAKDIDRMGEEGPMTAAKQTKKVVGGFRNTEEAQKFGEANKDNSKVLNSLRNKREKLLIENRKIMTKKNQTDEQMQKAMDNGVEAQLYREALEAAEGKLKNKP